MRTAWAQLYNNYSNASSTRSARLRKQTRVAVPARQLRLVQNLSDQDCIQQTRFEAFLDVHSNPSIERAPTSFAILGINQVNVKYDLPMGRDTSVYGPLTGAGGWYISGIYTWQGALLFRGVIGRGVYRSRVRSGTIRQRHW